ncbi:MAG: DUF3298 and DUF4163 domain-containing protein [Chlorobium sp.]
MRVTLLHFFAIPVLMFVLSGRACNGSGPHDPSSFSGTPVKAAAAVTGYEMKRFEKVYSDAKTPGERDTWCKGEYPVFSGGAAASSINRMVAAWIADSTALSPGEGYSGPRTPEALAGHFLKVYDKDRQETGMGMPYQFELSGAVLLNGTKLLTMQLSSYAYTGGAHGMHMTTCFVFDAATGRRLVIDDVFVPGFKDRLNALIEARFREERGLSASDRLDGEKGGLFENRIAFTTNFAMTPSGVVFLYNPYEIASYAAGQTEIELHYGELKGLLKPEYLDVHRDQVP